MSTEQICEIVQWIRDHKQHWVDNYETFAHDTPIEIWFRFCRKPDLIEEYESYGFMCGDEVDNGCDFIFSNGPLISSRCNRPLKDGKRCKFHGALIFSDKFRRNLARLSTIVNEHFGSPGVIYPPREFKFKKFGKALRREQEHGLILKNDDLLCIGYCAYDDPEVAPILRLTKKQRLLCDKLGIYIETHMGSIINHVVKYDYDYNFEDGDDFFL